MLETYRGFLTRAVNAKWITIAATLALFAGALLALPLVPNQFFPASDRPELLVDLRLPQNASIYASESVAERFDASSRMTRMSIGGAPTSAGAPSASICQWTCNFRTTSSRRPSSSPRMSQRAIVSARRWRNLLANEFPNVVGRIYPLELGPPVGWPIQYRVSGPQISEVRQIALKLAQTVAANPNAEKVNFDWIEPTREIRIVINQDEARQLGLSSDTLATVLNTVVSGNTVTQVRDDIYLINVVARATDEQRVSLDDPAQHPGPAPQRAHRTSEPNRDVRVRSGLSRRLAARPRAPP